MSDAQFTPGDLIAKYREIRDKKEALEKAQKEALKPYKDGLETIANYLLKLMHEQNVTSFKCEHGTAFQKTTMSVHTADKEALFKFVEETGSFDLLTAAVSKDTLQVFLDEHNDTPPPGVDVKFFTEVQVRKPS